MNSHVGIDNSDVRAGHLAVVVAPRDAGAARDAAGAAPAGPVASSTGRSATGASYGSAVPTSGSRHEAGVRAIAARYDSFEDALLPMVLASGVAAEAAPAVAEAIQSNPALRAQAERAFQRARMSVV